MPPAGTLDTEGFIKKPGVAPICTTAVLEVIVPFVVLVVVLVVVVVVVLVVVLVCCATAVIFT